MAPYKAVIWDMDGVIADTGPFHFTAWRRVFAEAGVDYSEADFTHHFGQRNDTIVRSTLGQDVTDAEIAVIHERKEAYFREAVAGHIRPFPGVIPLLKSLKQHGFKIAIGSSAPPENISLVTGALGIAEYFDATVTGQDVTEGKPSPQVFLLAARRLDAEPGRCVVIEDAVAGVEAAKRAGMRCLAVANSHPQEALAAADRVVDSLAEISYADLEALIEGVTSKMERSLVLVKPDAMQRGLAGEVIARLQKIGLKLVAVKMLHASPALAQRHYAVHKGKPFYDGLVSYISSSPIVACVFEGDDVIQRIRKAVGNTDPKKAEKGTIRGDLGVDIERNTIHASDSPETAATEIKIFFRDDEIFGY